MKNLKTKKMKKLFVIMVVGTFVLTSCKKDWTCECTLNGTALPSTTIEDMKKADAEKECTGGSLAGYTLSCNLK